MNRHAPPAITVLTTLLITMVIAGCQTTSTRTSATAHPLGSRSGSPTTPAYHLADGEGWLTKRYEAMQRDQALGEQLKKVRVVFVGDSITQFYAGEDDPQQTVWWRTTFGDPERENYALNLGVAGDRTENVLLRLLPKALGGFGQLDNPEIQPEVIVLMIGTNNTWSTFPDVVEQTVVGQLAVVNRLRALRPTATLIVNSIPPTNNEVHDRELVEPINRALKTEIKRMGGIIWIDAYAQFVQSDGRGNPKLFKDGVHPNFAGYQAWSALLLEALSSARLARQSKDK